MRVEHKLKTNFISKLKIIIFIIIIILVFVTAFMPSNISFSLSVRELYVLHNNFILNFGTIVYIYNNLVQFIDLRPITKFILAEDNIIPIKIYSTVIIIYIIFSRPTRVPLINIAYILGYHTNLILL